MTSQEDPFAGIRLRKKISQPNEMPIDLSLQNKITQSNQFQEEDPFANVRVKKVEGFPFLAEGGRHIARTASRIGEVIGGIPGDIQNLIQSGVFAGLEKLVGIPVSEQSRQEVKKHRAPTSTELKDLSQEMTGGFTAPQNDFEKSIDEYVETAASLLGPMKFRKALGVGLGSQLAKEGIKLSGLGETPQELGKLGTMFFLTTLNPKGALNYASSQYNKANALSKGASIQAYHFQGHLQNLVNDLKHGVITTEKNAVIKPAEELIAKVKNGKILVQDLTSAKRDINSIAGEPGTLKGAKKLLNVLGKQVDNAIKPYEKINPAFAKAYRPANEIYGAVMQGNKASNFIKRTIGPKSVLASLVGETVLGHPEAMLPTVGIAAGAYGGAKTLDFMTRLVKSRELQKYYTKAMSAAIAEDSRELLRYADKIQKIMEDQSSSFSIK